jgi:hypothetical protein
MLVPQESVQAQLLSHARRQTFKSAQALLKAVDSVPPPSAPEVDVSAVLQKLITQSINQIDFKLSSALKVPIQRIDSAALSLAPRCCAARIH